MKIRLVFIFLLALLTQLPSHAQSLASKIDVQGVPRFVQISGLTSKQQNGLLSLAIEFSNSTYNDQEAYYRISWLDDGGFPAWDEEPWKPVLVHGNFKEQVIVISPTTKARDFKIQFSAEKNWGSSRNAPR